MIQGNLKNADYYVSGRMFLLGAQHHSKWLQLIVYFLLPIECMWIKRGQDRWVSDFGIGIWEWRSSNFLSGCRFEPQINVICFSSSPPSYLYLFFYVHIYRVIARLPWGCLVMQKTDHPLFQLGSIRMLIIDRSKYVCKYRPKSVRVYFDASSLHKSQLQIKIIRNIGWLFFFLQYSLDPASKKWWFPALRKSSACYQTFAVFFFFTSDADQSFIYK